MEDIQNESLSESEVIHRSIIRQVSRGVDTKLNKMLEEYKKRNGIEIIEFGVEENKSAFGAKTTVQSEKPNEEDNQYEFSEVSAKSVNKGETMEWNKNNKEKKCLITGEFCENPVVFNGNEFYEKSEILKHLVTQLDSPFSGFKMRIEDLKEYKP